MQEVERAWLHVGRVYDDATVQAISPIDRLLHVRLLHILATTIPLQREVLDPQVCLFLQLLQLEYARQILSR